MSVTLYRVLEASAYVTLILTYLLLLLLLLLLIGLVYFNIIRVLCACLFIRPIHVSRDRSIPDSTEYTSILSCVFYRRVAAIRVINYITTLLTRSLFVGLLLAFS